MRSHKLGLWVLFLPLTQSCYSFVRTDRIFGYNQVAVPTFKEETPVGIAPQLTDELSHLLAADGLTLVAQQGQVEATLYGRIVSATTINSPSVLEGAIPAYSIRVRIACSLRDNASRELWSTTFELTEDFIPSPASDAKYPLESEANRRRALVLLSRRAASEIQQRLLVASHYANKPKRIR